VRATLAAFVALLAAFAAVGVARSTHHKPKRPPIVFLVFDALPGSMLMRRDGSLDAERFPGFAELARRSTWYRNATTVNDSTVKSVPAMLDGRWPSNLRHPTLADHPVNLFTLLSGAYRIWADEQGTELCPRSVCRAEVRKRLLYLLHGRREQRFAAALQELERQSGNDLPQLWFVHVLLPHEPLRFLPSGKVYEPGSDPEPGLDGNESFDNAWLTLQAEQRHLLQLRFTDRLLQRLIARLRQTGLYDDAAIVVTADHGISFRRKPRPSVRYRLGQLGWRRDMTAYSAQDVAFVPLFVKAPGQQHGAVSDTWARTVDILPTLLSYARLTMPRALAGQALGDPRARPQLLPVLTNRRGPLILDPAALERRRAATLERRAATFGTGADVDRLFRFGPHTELIGQRLDALRVTRATRVRARLWGARRYLDVDLGGRRVPALVTGWIEGGKPAGRDLALALNGRIAAVSRSFKPIGTLGLNLSSLVPESAFRQGANDLRLFEVLEHGPRLALRPLASVTR
jgi:hypothetical protein